MVDDGEKTKDSQLRPRTSVAAAMDPMGDGSGLCPFWDYEQEKLDASTVKWTVETNVDGSLSTLYVQAPYGYQGDLLQADKSIILSRIADAMRHDGHDDWADIIEADKVWSIDWRSGACQAIGFSYRRGKALDANKLKALASYDPYDIHVFNEDLLSGPATDEKQPSRTETDSMTMGSLGLLSSVVGALAAFTTPGAIVVSIASVIYSAVMFSIGAKAYKKRTQSQLERPGFILETTSGWLVWQYDSSSYSTPRRLVESATRQVDKWINGKYKYDEKPLVTEVATSTDGRMTWFRSDRRLDVECELSPYQAEQYLSLFVKHQSNPDKMRSYPRNEPTIIMSTVTESALPSQANRLEEPKSVWTSDEAVKRANDRLDAVDNENTEDAAMTDQSMRLEAMARDLISKATIKNGPASVNAVRMAGAVLTALKNTHDPEDLARIEAELITVNDELDEANANPAELAAMAGLKAMSSSTVRSADDGITGSGAASDDGSNGSMIITTGATDNAIDSTDSETIAPSTSEAESNPFLRNRI